MGEGWNERAVRVRNAPEKPDRWAKKRIKARRGWRVETRWSEDEGRSLILYRREWHGRPYLSEAAARNAYENYRTKALTSPFSPDQVRLVGPDGTVRDEHHREKVDDGIHA